MSAIESIFNNRNGCVNTALPTLWQKKSIRIRLNLDSQFLKTVSEFIYENIGVGTQNQGYRECRIYERIDLFRKPRP